MSMEVLIIPRIMLDNSNGVNNHMLAEMKSIRNSHLIN